MSELPDRPYLEMTASEGRTALEAFVAERPAALARLLESSGDGLDLDGGPASVDRLWAWMRPQLEAGGAADGQAPSWSRWTSGVHEQLSSHSLLLVDGLISYVAEVLRAAVPGVAWVVDDDPHPRYVHRNQPALSVGAWTSAIPVRLAGTARQVVGDHPPPPDRVERLVQMWLDEAAAASVAVGSTSTGAPEPAGEAVPPDVAELVEVHPLSGGGSFEVTLDEALTGDDAAIEALVARLGAEHGVLEAYREDREVLLVRAPGWDARRLRTWVVSDLGGR